MCGCNAASSSSSGAIGTALATSAGASFGMAGATAQAIDYLAIPFPGGQTLQIPYVTPQPLPGTTITVRPYPWGWILAGVVGFLILTKGGR